MLGSNDEPVADEDREDAWWLSHEICEGCDEALCLESARCDCGLDAGKREGRFLAFHVDSEVCGQCKRQRAERSAALAEMLSKEAR